MLDFDKSPNITRKGIGAVAGIGAALGAVAFGAFLARRHSSANKPDLFDDAPGFARRNPQSRNALVGRSVTINKPAHELYAFWRDFNNLAGFMENLESVTDHGGGRSTWHIKAPAGQTVTFESEITEDREGEVIAWRSTDASQIKGSGKVTFEVAPGDRGTRVGLDIAYDPPGGALGQAIAKLFLREPQVQARHDLKRFRMLMETGEIATSAQQRNETRAQKQENS